MTPPLTTAEAAELHLVSLRSVCENIRTHRHFTSVLVATPDERVEELHGVLDGCVSESWKQGDGDLGRRLSRASNRAFEAGAEAVLLIGADSPTLPVRHVMDAVAAVASHDAVLGPTRDGGYYLLGMRRPIPLLLDRIDWGSDRVAEQTRQRAVEIGIDLAEIQSWYDLDRFDDLRSASDDLCAANEPLGLAAASLKRLISNLIERYPNG